MSINVSLSRSYQNDFSFDLDSSSSLQRLNRLNKKPTSLSLSGNNLNNKLNEQPPSPSVNWFIMTGDCILNLSKTNSEENPMILAGMANFKAEKGMLNKQKIRKLKEEKRKLVTRVNSNTMKNCVTNSDQMRECLSPEIRHNSPNDDDENSSNEESCVDKLSSVSNEGKIDDEKDESSNNDKLEQINNCINDQLTNSNDEENLINSPDSAQLTSDTLDDNQPKDEQQPNEQSTASTIEETATSTKRYPTFIQQNESGLDSPTDEQQNNNLHQKSIDEASAKRLARRLYNLDKFKKIDVSRHLCKNNEYSKAVGAEYCNFFDFTDITLVDALRMFLSKFCLIGETQERERILFQFAKRYFTCNSSVYASADTIYTLTCSLMLLNQDLHGDCVSKKMSLNDFVENLRSLNNGENFSRDLLKELYNKIKNEKLEWCSDSDDLKDDSYSNIFGNGSLTIANTGLEIPNSSNSMEYKRGYILRKCCLQTNGKKVSLGKRKWKCFYAVLRDTVLYLHKDDQSIAKSQIYDSVKNSIRIHHAVAFVASDYVKRKWVFRLSTADGSEFLISVNSKQEMDSWIECINFLAACLSCPPTGESMSEKKKKKYPLKTVLPVNNTKYQFKEQLNDHESRRIRINDEIQDITQSLRTNYNLIGKKTKAHVLQLKYLKHEYERYTAYCKVMKKVKQNPSQSSILEKTSKSLSAIKSKPLTTLVIGEEQLDEQTKSLVDEE